MFNCELFQFLMTEGLISIVVKWQGKEIELSGLEGVTSVGEMKQQLEERTFVRKENQKLMGLKCKAGGTQMNDSTVLSEIVLKPNMKVMMMGTPDAEIEKANTRPEDLPDVIDDFDIPTMEDLPTDRREEFLAKIEKRVKDYKVEVLNAPDANKKLLGSDLWWPKMDKRRN